MQTKLFLMILVWAFIGVSRTELAFATTEQAGEKKEFVVKSGYTLTKTDMEEIRNAAIHYLQTAKLKPVMADKKTLFLTELKEGDIVMSDPSGTDDFGFPRIGRWIFQVRENHPTLSRKAASEDYNSSPKMFFLFGLNLRKIDGKWQVKDDFNIKMGKRT